MGCYAQVIGSLLPYLLWNNEHHTVAYLQHICQQIRMAPFEVLERNTHVSDCTHPVIIACNVNEV